MSPEEFKKLVNLQKLKHKAGILIPKKAKPQPKTATAPAKRPGSKPTALGICGGPKSEFAKKVASRLRDNLGNMAGIKNVAMWQQALAESAACTRRMERRLGCSLTKSK